jgi:hypothetical protein
MSYIEVNATKIADARRFLDRNIKGTITMTWHIADRYYIQFDDDNGSYRIEYILKRSKNRDFNGFLAYQCGFYTFVP